MHFVVVRCDCCASSFASSFCIACMTVTGVSAIVTNGKMRPGGPYFLISRTLGAELGGAIGVVLLAEHVIASVYFLSTFGEIVSLSSNTVTVRGPDHARAPLLDPCAALVAGQALTTLHRPRAPSTTRTSTASASSSAASVC